MQAAKDFADLLEKDVEKAPRVSLLVPCLFCVAKCYKVAMVGSQKKSNSILDGTIDGSEFRRSPLEVGSLSQCVYLSFIHPNAGDLGFLVAIKTIFVESSHDFPTPHCVGSGPTETCG